MKEKEPRERKKKEDADEWDDVSEIWSDEL